MRKEPNTNEPTAQLQLDQIVAKLVSQAYRAVERPIAELTSPNSSHTTDPKPATDAGQERITNARSLVHFLDLIGLYAFQGINDAGFWHFPTSSVFPGACG